MAKIFTPPASYADDLNHTVFLAGSIEMDKAVKWQDEIIKKLEVFEDLTILNPRRSNWDSSWKQDINNPDFNLQVNWELDGIEKAHTVIFYFDPNTKSPITLMELGMVSQIAKDKDFIICCPEGFWRKGNVDIITQRMEMKMRDSIKTHPMFTEEKKQQIIDGIMKYRLYRPSSLDELIEDSYEYFRYQFLW